MKKRTIVGLAAMVTLGNASIAISNATPTYAEGEGEVEASSSVSASSSEEESEPKVDGKPTFDYVIGSVSIGYRDSEDVSYAKGDETIGNWYVSADGWNEEDAFEITLNAKGNVVTKLESKVVYIYEYRPTLVKWLGETVSQNADTTYTLKKPTEKGSYDLEIDFTKTLVTNPMDLTSLNWASLLTLPNLMTILSWVVIVVGILVLYGLNRRYRKRGSTTLEEVKKSLSSEIENVYGKELADSVSSLFDTTIKKSFESIDSRLAKVDSNNATLIRCLLVMQENTPEARLAVAKYLSELDVAEDSKASEVKALIEAEMAKYKAEAEAREKAIEDAKKTNGEWKEKSASSKKEETEPQPDASTEDGTTI